MNSQNNTATSQANLNHSQNVSPITSANTSLNNVSMQSVDSELSPSSTPPHSSSDPSSKTGDSTPSSIKSNIMNESLETPMVMSPPKNVETSAPSDAVSTTLSSVSKGDYGIKRTIVNTSKENPTSDTTCNTAMAISVLGSNNVIKTDFPPSTTVPLSSIPTLVGNGRGSHQVLSNRSTHIAQNTNRPSPYIQPIPVIGHSLANQQPSATHNAYVSSNQSQVSDHVIRP